MTKRLNHFAILLSTLLATSALISACGGGGGSGSGSTSNPNPTPTPVLQDPDWAPGTFIHEANFAARCEAPRTGSDDQAGSIVWENHWIRAYSYRTYLWYDQLPDIDPATVSTTEDYFDLMRSTATTTSGKPLDDFHFIIPTEIYEALSQSGSIPDYGMGLAFVEDFPPRRLTVGYIEPGSPADQAGVTRGMNIIGIDDVDLVNTTSSTEIDLLNLALFPNEGQTHAFTFETYDQNSKFTVNLTAEIIEQAPILVTDIITQDDQSIGYLMLNTFGSFTAESAIFDAMTELSDSGINELVLDLRYNGGGLTVISSQLAYMIAGAAATSGKTYVLDRFNDKYPNTNPITGNDLTPMPFIPITLGIDTDPELDLPTLDLNRVYVLSSGDTCSASEAVINGLRGIDVDVILIGDTTCGKPYSFYAIDNCGSTYFTVQSQIVNHQGFGDYADGFTPTADTPTIDTEVQGCLLAEDFAHQLGDENETLLNAALYYQANGTCPASNVAKLAPRTEAASDRPPALAIGQSERAKAIKALRHSQISVQPDNGKRP